MSNYYVHRNHDYDDELEHSLGSWIKARARGAHKYIAKIPVGGKMRYFYSQAELAAYKAGKTVSKAATNVNNRLTVGRAQARYTVKRISDTARAKVGNAVNNLTGASAKKQMNAAKAKADYSLSKVRAAKGTDNYDSAVNRARGNMRVYIEAKNRYDKSLLGRAERAGKAIGGAAGRVRNAAANSAVGKAVGRTAKNAENRLRILNSEGRYRVKQIGDTARAKATNAIDNVTGAGAKRRMESAKGKVDYALNKVRSAKGTSGYDSAVNRARGSMQTYNKAKKKYDNSLLGRAERAGKAVSGAAGKGKSAATSAAGTVRKTARKAGKVASSAAKKVGRAVDRLDTAIYNARVDAQNKRAQATTKKSTKKRPHQRKTKKVNGTATVRKGDRVYY